MGKLITVEELAQRLRLTKRTIYRLLSKGDIPAIKVGHKWRSDEEVINAWLHPEIRGDGKRILVIDDDPVIGILFKEALGKRGYTVVTAGNGAEGLEYVNRLGFGLIFLDLKMPKMDGAEILRRIRNVKPQVPVTIMTGYPDSDIMNRALQQGHFSVMKKPFSTADIVAAVNR